MKQIKPTLFKDAIFTIFISSVIISSISLIHLISRHFEITKKVMLAIVYVSYVTHILLYAFEIPTLQILLSLSVEIFLHRLLCGFPDIPIKSFNFYYAFIAFVINEVWMAIYMANSNLSTTEIVICVVVTSLAPLTLFYYAGGILNIIK